MKRALLGTAVASFALVQSLSAVAEETDKPGADTGDASTLPEIRVTAPVEASASKVTVDEGELSAIGPTDLQDVFSGEAAAQVGGSIPTAQKLFVHGIEDQLLNVQIDGVRQSPQNFHHNGTILIDPSLLKSVEIDAGVAPADAGPYALGGAVQFTTKDARDLLEPGENLGWMSKLTFETNAETFTHSHTGYAQAAGFDLLAHYTMARGDDYEDGRGQTVRGTEAGLDSALVKIGRMVGEGYRLGFNFEWAKDDADRHDRVNFANVVTYAADFAPNIFERKTFSITLEDEQQEGWFNPEVTLTYNDAELEVQGLSAGPPPTFTIFSDIESLTAQVQNVFAFDLGTVTAGVDFESLTAEGGRLTHMGDEDSTTLGFFGQARFDLAEFARVSFGGRGDQQWFKGLDGSDFSNFGVSGNFSGELDVFEWVTLKAGVSNVFGGIPLGESAIQEIFGPWTYDGIEPSRSTNLSAGFALHPFDGLTTEFRFFQTDIDDAHNLASAVRSVTADVETTGVDAAIRYEAENAYAYLTYTNTNLEIDESDPGTTAYYYGTPIGQMFGLLAGYTFETLGLTLGGSAQMALDEEDVASTDPSVTELEGYEVFNLFAEYSHPNFDILTFRVDVRNLFDEDYVDRASSGIGANGGVVEPLFEPGRAFLLRATAEF